MITLQVSEFGPIIEGKVTVKPLTLFIGPNNSGKSYLAVLAYALFRSFPPVYPFPLILARRLIRRRIFPQRYLRGMEDVFATELWDNEETRKSLQEWLTKYSGGIENRKMSVLVKDLPGELRSAMEMSLRSLITEDAASLGEELKRCYGDVIRELTRRTAKRPFNIIVTQGTPPLRVEMSPTNDSLQAREPEFDVSNISLSMPPAALLRRHTDEPLQVILYKLIEDFLQSACKEFSAAPYYFPAARSGILQSHKALASYVVSLSPLAGIEKLPEVPRLQGVVVDFISKLLYLEKDRRTKLYHVATFLEKEVTKGVIDIEAGGKFEYPEIYYKPDSGKFPLHRTSSMVSELAPMVLFLKYLIEPGDFVIIEEPESHLHPESQRKLAAGIVRLIRENVKVLITTHSGDFVDQLSNHIRLGQLSEEQRIKLGYSKEDYLLAEEVGAFLFRPDTKIGGTRVEELKITAQDGIPEEEFAKVKEALYKETVYLHRAASR